MLGAIAGDVIGSIHEGAETKTKQFELFGPHLRFTDDTVQTAAVAQWILHDTSLVDWLHEYFDRYPQAGYGDRFIRWASQRSRQPYNSWGNGSAMRVSPIGLACQTIDETLELARLSAEVTHNHPEGIRGAQSTAAAVFLARKGRDKLAIKSYVEQRFGYDLSTPLDAMRSSYTLDLSCQGSVPHSIRAFLEANDFEDAIRNAVSLGGDADTMACIAGGIAEAFWGVPNDIATQTRELLDDHLRAVVDNFSARFGPTP